MSFADEIALKRQEAAKEKASQTLHQENLNAVTDSGRGVVAATGSLAKSTDIDSLIKQVKEVQLAAMLGASKPSVVLTDQTDLGDRISELSTKLSDTVKGLDSSDVNSQQLAELKSVSLALIQLKKNQSDGDTATQKAIAKLTQAVAKINLSPTVNVPTPKVTVQAPAIDLTPITDALNKQADDPDEAEGIDLECYRAQDIDNTNKDIQYVGFVNPEGAWYIIENDVKGNKMRYVFGMSDYAAAFSKAATYTYSLLNEAIDALTA